MSDYPDDFYYSKEHEWVSVDGEVGTIGITDYAQNSLGDIVYVELPDVGASFDAGDEFGTVESVKAVSELFMPISGEILEINEELLEDPAVINSDPYDSGWMIRVSIANSDELEELLSATAYEDMIAEEEE